MNRRITHGLLPITGGLLGAAALPIAAAFAAPANYYGGIPIIPPTDTQVVGFFGVDPSNKLAATYSPGLSDSAQAWGQIHLGGVDGSEQIWADISGNTTNTTYLVGTSTFDGIQPGSLFEFDDYSFLGFKLGALYSDVISLDSHGDLHHTFTSALVTPLGNIRLPFNLDLSKSVFVPFHGYGDLNKATYLEPDQLKDHLLDTKVFADDSKYSLDPHEPAGPPGVADDSVMHAYNWAPNAPLQIEAISGLPPLDVAVQGFQTFNVVGPHGETGSFTAAVTNTGDMVLNASQAVLVTDSGDSGVPVGSLFMDFYLLNGKIINHYIDIYNPDGPNKIYDYLAIMDKDGNVKSTIDASWVANLFDGASHYNDNDFEMGGENGGHGYTITPAGYESIVATNGIPPISIAVLGYRDYDIAFEKGGEHWTTSFTADETTSWTWYNDVFSRSLLVTDSDDTSLVGNGSVFMDWTAGNGWGNFYYDIVSSVDGTHDAWNVIYTPWFDIPLNVSPLVNFADWVDNFFHPADLTPLDVTP